MGVFGFGGDGKIMEEKKFRKWKENGGEEKNKKKKATPSG